MGRETSEDSIQRERSPRRSTVGQLVSQAIDTFRCLALEHAKETQLLQGLGTDMEGTGTKPGAPAAPGVLVHHVV